MGVDGREQLQLDVDALRRGLDDQIDTVERLRNVAGGGEARRLASASAVVVLPNSTAFRRIASIVEWALVNCASDTSHTRVANPDEAAACATPWPIVPAPRTAIVRTVMWLS